MHTLPLFQRSLLIFISALLLCSLSACQLDSLIRNDESSTSENASSYIESESGEESPGLPVGEELVLHPLTGLFASEKDALARPLAFVLGNTDSALPQYGTGAADILIEAPCGDDTTKLMVITTKYKEISKIGGIREAMPYLGVLATAFNATLVHSGSDEAGKENVLSTAVSPSAFYKESGRLSPHNIFTSVSRLENAMNILGISKDLPESVPVFSFAEDKETISLSGKVATHLLVEYSPTQRTEFRYNPGTGVYTRYQNGVAVSDSQSGDVLTCQNVLVLYCDSTLNENAGGSSLSLSLKNGSGVYATDGSYLSILWYLNDDGEIIFTREDGTALLMNPGVTHIELVKSSKKNSVTLDCN